MALVSFCIIIIIIIMSSSSSFLLLLSHHHHYPYHNIDKFDVYWTVHHCDSCASAGSPDTTPAEPRPISNTQQIKNETANVVVQQHSRKIPEDEHINARNMFSL